jgi:hypothetical protein
MTPEIALQKTRNPFELADLLKIHVDHAKELLTKDLERLPGWGRVKMQKYIISRRFYAAEWPREDLERIKTHQIFYDKGMVNMTQGRDGNYILLYSIPTKRTEKREPYFTRREVY